MGISWSGLLATVALGTLANACCTSRQRASEIDAELHQQNIARAEPIMREVALQQQAKLLPDQVRPFGLMPVCAAQASAGPRQTCVLSESPVLDFDSGFGETYRILDHDGNRHVAIAIGEVPRSTRLARRGKTFFVLIPTVTNHKTNHRTACECDGGQVIVSMSDHVNLGRAFVVDDLSEVEVREIRVPIVEDYIEWTCKQMLL